MRDLLERRRYAVTAAVFALAFLGVSSTLTDPGIVWDEPDYFGSAQRQARWVGMMFSDGPAAALDRETVFDMWDWHHYWNPHPPVYKEGMALTWSLTRDWLGPLAALRLFPALCFAILVSVAFLWGSAAWSGVGGLGAALSIALMPRVFGHAHFGATETPLALFWFAATAAGWWAVTRESRAGWIMAGIAWGLAAGTKFLGIAAVAPVLGWGVCRDWRRVARGGLVLVVMALTVFVLLNPMMWVDAAGYLKTWIWESTHRGEYAPISTWYQGRRWGFDVPWHHVFVMTAAVLPLGIAGMAIGGIASGVRERDSVTALALVTVVFAWLIMLIPGAPHHNGVRQFLYLFPFLGMLAGRGFHVSATKFSRRTSILVFLLVLGPAAVQLVTVHPYYLSYYGEAVGGLQGARERGFETTYWMDSVATETREWMNTTLPKGATVQVLGPQHVLELERAFGRLRSDLQFTDEPPADFMLVPSSQTMIGDRLRETMERVSPVHEVRRHGVPILRIYRVKPNSDRG